MYWMSLDVSDLEEPDMLSGFNCDSSVLTETGDPEVDDGFGEHPTTKLKPKIVKNLAVLLNMNT